MPGISNSSPKTHVVLGLVSILCNVNSMEFEFHERRVHRVRQGTAGAPSFAGRAGLRVAALPHVMCSRAPLGLLILERFGP